MTNQAQLSCFGLRASLDIRASSFVIFVAITSWSEVNCPVKCQFRSSNDELKSLADHPDLQFAIRQAMIE